MKTKILHISALCALVVGLSGCTVHSSGTYAHVGGGIYASSGDYYRYHRAPIRERVVVVPQQRVVVAPRPVVVAPQKRVVVAPSPVVVAPNATIHDKKHHIGVPKRSNSGNLPRNAKNSIVNKGNSQKVANHASPRPNSSKIGVKPVPKVANSQPAILPPNNANTQRHAGVFHRR